MKQPYDPSLLTRIKDKMISQQLTLSVAESVTAGNLQVALSQSEGATQFFQGGITTYNIGQKARHLNVDPIYALKCNCVDELITGQMALQANQLFLSSYAIGITGYAVKMPEQDINELYAYVAIAVDGIILLSKKIKGNSALEEGYATQVFYTNEALKVLSEALEKRILS